MLEQQKKVNDLVDGIGSFIEYWGFRKIHGRVWGSIYLSNKPLSTPEIVSSLGVSKALISGALNELVEHGLIVREGQVKYGGVTYVACSNPAEVVRDVIRNRELVLFTKIQNDLQYIEKLKSDEMDELGVSKKSLNNLKLLTGYHKKIAQKLCKKKIKTIDEWISFIKNVSRFTI